MSDNGMVWNIVAYSLSSKIRIRNSFNYVELQLVVDDRVVL